MHAPFHLTASRADLHRSPENTQRRDAIAPAFLHGCQANQEVAANALKYLGTEPAEPFWLPVRAAILAGLRSVACVMTESGPVKPDGSLVRGEDPIAKWVPDGLLFDACGLRFATGDNPREAIRELGVRKFSITELLSCLCHFEGKWLKDMWCSPSRSCFFSDLYSSLADALTADPSLQEKLYEARIFPLAAEGPASTNDSGGSFGPELLGTSINLYTALCDSVPRASQLPLVKCLSPELQVTVHGQRLFQLMGVEQIDETGLERLALRALLASSNASGDQKTHMTALWAALCVLRYRFLLGQATLRPWAELNGAIALPSALGEMLPPCRLRLWSFLGVMKEIPSEAFEKVYAFAGMDVPCGVPELEPMALPPMDPDGIDWTIGWEVFLSALGCASIDPIGMAGECSLEATLKLGGVLSSGAFWRQAAESDSTMAYLNAALGDGANAQRRCWLRRLPVRFKEETIALEDLFVHQIFHRLAGNHVPYLEGAPTNPRVFALLRGLGVAAEVTTNTLLKCLRWARSHGIEDVGLAADIYVQLDQLGYCGPGNEELILVPNRGYMHAEDCAWQAFRLALLQRCCRLEALVEHYSRFGSNVCNTLQLWVQESANRNAGELCDALLQVIKCAKADPGNPHRPVGKESVQPDEAVKGLFSAAKEVTEALSQICVGDGAVVARATVFDYFIQHRMIAVGSPDCLLLHMGEAYWSVAPELQRGPCAAWALELHYGGAEHVRQFFTEVLSVRRVLTQEDVERSMSKPPGTPSVDGLFGTDGASLQEGLDLRSLFAHSQDQVDTFDPIAALTAGLRRAQTLHPPEDGCRDRDAEVPAHYSGTPSTPVPRTWRLVGNLGGVPVFAANGANPPQVYCPDLTLLNLACHAFGLQPTQIAFAYDPTGRCVCEDRLFIDIERLPRTAELPSVEGLVSFWVLELASAIAHQGTGPLIDGNLLQVQSDLAARALPRALQMLYNVAHHNG